MIKACIFDLDGTLLDTLETIRYYLNTTFKKYSLPEIDRETCRTIVGKGARNLLSCCFNIFGINDPEFFERVFADYNAAYDANPHHLTAPYAGIVDLLSELSARGVKLAVLSNKPEISTVAVAHHFFGDVFDIVSGGRAGVALKPDPESADAVLSTLGVDISECAYIGDSEVDVQTAKALKPGLPIAVTWGFRTREQLASEGATTLIDTADELRQLLLSNLA